MNIVKFDIIPKTRNSINEICPDNNKSPTLDQIYEISEDYYEFQSLSSSSINSEILLEEALKENRKKYETLELFVECKNVPKSKSEAKEILSFTKENEPQNLSILFCVEIPPTNSVFDLFGQRDFHVEFLKICFASMLLLKVGFRKGI